MNKNQLLSPGAKALLNDLYQQVNTTYVGQTDTNTGALQGGIEQIAASLQHLATIEVRPYGA
jgi:hypothetical protein